MIKDDKQKLLNDSYYFMGEIQESQYFSNLINHVGIIHDTRDLNLILTSLPIDPKRYYVKRFIEGGLIEPIVSEVKYLNEALEGNKPLPSISSFPALQSMLRIIADPITVYESTLLPIMRKDIGSIFLTDPVKNELLQIHDDEADKDAINLLYDTVGNKSFIQMIAENADALDYLLANTKLEDQTVYGQTFISYISEVVSLFLSERKPRLEWIRPQAYNLITKYVSRMHEVMAEKNMVTTPASSKGFMTVIPSLRRNLGEIIRYDGANLDSVTEVVKGFRNSGTKLAITPNDIVNRHSGLILITSETAGGKTSLAEAMQIWTKKYAGKEASRFDRVHLSEPNRPALLGTEGTNEAIEYALHNEAETIVIDSMSHIPVNYAKGQPLTSKGVSWNVREIFMALGILCMAHGKTIVVILNVESGQKSIYSDLFKGISYVTYTKDGISQRFWDITLREADSRIRQELRVNDKDVFSTLENQRHMSEELTDKTKYDINSGADPYFRKIDLSDLSYND